MRLEGRLKLGFYPLPVGEAERLRVRLQFPQEFSALDPCVGDGVAFGHLLEGTGAHNYGFEVDCFRAEEAAQRAIRVLEANVFHVRCAAESISLLYLNPPYDFAADSEKSERQEKSFLEHTFRWLKPRGVLLFIVPQAQVANWRPAAGRAVHGAARLSPHRARLPATSRPTSCIPRLRLNVDCKHQTESIMVDSLPEFLAGLFRIGIGVGIESSGKR
jgi:hypothetical protein